MLLSKVTPILKRGGIGVIPTDTIYGIVAKALDRKAVKRLYRLRRKTPKKPFIILIDSPARLHEFGVHPTPTQQRFLKKIWPGKVSVIFPCNARKLSYLHLGTKTLAFRLPKRKGHRALLKKVGPLVAPSANLEGKKPAETISEAKRYFGESVDVYASVGRLKGKPSTVVSLLGASPKILRKGATSIPLA